MTTPVTIYIDFLSTISHFGGAKYHGGGNYARRIAYYLATQSMVPTEIILICPFQYVPDNVNENELYGLSNVLWINSDKSFSNIDFKENSLVFFPILMATPYDIIKIKAIKKRTPSIIICGTIHDTRFLSPLYDFTNKYYLDGLKRLLYPPYYFFIHYLAKRIIMRNVLRQVARNVNRVFTVSNYSMQSILKESKQTNLRVSWYYQSVSRAGYNIPVNHNENDYILFLSGARHVKNLAHALLGYSIFMSNNRNSDLRLVITGTNQATLDNLLELKGINSEAIVDKITLVGYVDEKKLAELYTNCKFVLYTSKYANMGSDPISGMLKMLRKCYD